MSLSRRRRFNKKARCLWRLECKAGSLWRPQPSGPPSRPRHDRPISVSMRIREPPCRIHPWLPRLSPSRAITATLAKPIMRARPAPASFLDTVTTSENRSGW